MERSLAQLIRHAHEDVAFHVLAAELQPDLRPLAAWSRVPVPLRPFPARMVSFWIATAAMARRIKTDLVHTMGAITPMPADLVSVQFCHAAFQALPHGGERERVLRRANNAVTRELSLESERWCYRPSHVRRLAPASTGVEAELRRYYPGLPTTVIPNAADHERFRPDAAVRRSMRATLAIPDDAVVALFLGGDWERKGLAVTMEGIAQARRSGLDLHLWVVGSGDIQGYRDRARSLDDAAWCTFHGFTTEPERFLAAADVFVSPTAYEAFPLAALEAAASGLPVVATRVNGIAELIRDGQEGVIVERTAASIAAAFTLLAGDPTMRRRMGAAARTAAARYTWAAVSQSTISAYEGLLRSRDP